MNTNQSLEFAANAVRKLWEKHGIKEPMRFLGFCLSLLPIPGIQQAGQALDKHLSDKAFNLEVEKLWKEIKTINEAVSRVESLELAIQEIAKAINSNSQLAERVQKFIHKLGTSQREFSVLTENRSYQEIVNSLINSDVSTFTANNHSTNVISNTTVQSQVTRLHATNNSRNYVDRTSFQGVGGSVSMDKIATEGAVSIQGASVGLGPGGFVGFGVGGVLGFGGNPHEVTGTCPICKEVIKVDKRQLVGYTSIQCPKCRNNLPFTPPV